MSLSQRCKEHSDLILESALLSVSPENLIRKKIALDHSILSVSGSRFDLEKFHRIHLLGLGKGAAGLCREFEKIAGSRTAGGVVISGEIFYPENSKIVSLKGDHPVPGSNSAKAGDTLKQYAGNIQPDDLVLAFITGGSSAMAVSPPPGISLGEIAEVNSLLVRCGAGIGEINAVRKHLSTIKGGMLAEIIHPAEIISLIISDVIGSDPGTIGSGPFHGDSSTFSDALKVLKKHRIASQCSGEIIRYLERGIKGHEEETPAPENRIFESNHTFILGKNRDALDGAALKGEELGYRPFILFRELEGDVESEAREAALLIRKGAGEKRAEEQLILLGGECTVFVTGEGKGGRVQEFLLLLLRELLNVDFPFFAAGIGTDGIDGNTGDAGAWIHHGTKEILGDDPHGLIRDHLERNDSNTFFRNLNQHIHTGATGTNVMDVFLVLI